MESIETLGHWMERRLNGDSTTRRFVFEVLNEVRPLPRTEDGYEMRVKLLFRPDAASG